MIYDFEVHEALAVWGSNPSGLLAWHACRRELDDMLRAVGLRRQAEGDTEHRALTIRAALAAAGFLARIRAGAVPREWSAKRVPLGKDTQGRMSSLSYAQLEARACAIAAEINNLGTADHFDPPKTPYFAVRMEDYK